MNKTQNHTDWHQADIIAALRRRGTTLAAVSRSAGLDWPPEFPDTLPLLK